MNNLNRETASCIVDLFEDFLDAKGIKVENEERDSQDPDNETNIWGADFDELMNGIIGILGASGIHIADQYNSAEPNEPKCESLFIYVPFFDDIVQLIEAECDLHNRIICRVWDAAYIGAHKNFAVECREIPFSGIIREGFNSLVEAVPDVLNSIYGNIKNKSEISWIELSGGKAWR